MKSEKWGARERAGGRESGGELERRSERLREVGRKAAGGRERERALFSPVLLDPCCVRGWRGRGREPQGAGERCECVFSGRGCLGTQSDRGTGRRTCVTAAARRVGSASVVERQALRFLTGLSPQCLQHALLQLVSVK